MNSIANAAGRFPSTSNALITIFIKQMILRIFIRLLLAISAMLKAKI